MASSIDLASRKLNAIIGPNGAGKTTLFNLITGEIPADAGSVMFSGRDMVGLKPHQIVRWHRTGFRCYWHWTSQLRVRRPLIETDLRALIRRMSAEIPLWGAPHIHGELLKLGFEVAQLSIAKYMVKRRGPSSQKWRTFLRNHAPDVAAMDVVPTIGFDLLYGFVIVRLDRRDLVRINVTTNPTAEWIARQLTEAFPWNEAPLYLIRNRDRIYGTVITRRLRAMGMRDKPIAPASPWQNGFAERLIGSIRQSLPPSAYHPLSK